MLVHERNDDLYEIAQAPDHEHDFVVVVRLAPRIPTDVADTEELVQELAGVRIRRAQRDGERESSGRFIPGERSFGRHEASDLLGELSSP